MRQGELYDTLPRWRPHRSARIEGADVRTLGRDTAAGSRRPGDPPRPSPSRTKDSTRLGPRRRPCLAAALLACAALSYAALLGPT